MLRSRIVFLILLADAIYSTKNFHSWKFSGAFPVIWIHNMYCIIRRIYFLRNNIVVTIHQIFNFPKISLKLPCDSYWYYYTRLFLADDNFWSWIQTIKWESHLSRRDPNWGFRNLIHAWSLGRSFCYNSCWLEPLLLLRRHAKGWIAVQQIRNDYFS